VVPAPPRDLAALEAAIAGVLEAARVAPGFRSALAGHLGRYAAFSLERPDWYPAGIPGAICSSFGCPPEKGAMVAAGCIAYHLALDAMDDVQDGDLALWPDQSGPEVLNAGIALHVVAQEAFRLAGCGPAFFERYHALALETAAGQSLDLAWRPGRLAETREVDYFRIVSLKTGATFEIIARAACGTAGADPAATEALAAWSRELGTYMQALGDNDDAATEPSPDLAKGKPSLPLIFAYADLAPAERIALASALAAYADRDAARETVHRQLRETDAMGRARARVADMGRLLAARLDDLVPAEHRAAFRRLIYRLEDGMPPLPEKKPAKPAEPDWSELAPRGDQAAAALLAAPTCPESWDIHRWGFCGHPELVGDVFPVALVAAALQACGRDASAARIHLLARANADGWRYFPEMPELPPDADVLGQVLQVLAPGSDLPAVAAAASALVAHIAPSGAIPTWLEGAPDPADSQWGGNDCVAAIANAYYGLLRFDAARYAEIVHAGLPHLLAHLDRHGDWESFWYIPAYARYAAARLLAAAGRGDLPPFLAAAVSSALARTRDRVKAETRPDGAWNGPQDTALALLTLAAAGDEATDFRPGLRLLCDSQRGDGYWPAWPLYLIPARDGGYTWYGSKSATTAFCLRAISLNLGFTWA